MQLNIETDTCDEVTFYGGTLDIDGIDPCTVLESIREAYGNGEDYVAIFALDIAIKAIGGNLTDEDKAYGILDEMACLADWLLGSEKLTAATCQRLQQIRDACPMFGGRESAAVSNNPFEA